MILPFTGMRKCTYGPPCGYSLDRMGKAFRNFLLARLWNGSSERLETQQLDSPHVKTSWLVVKKQSWKIWLRQWVSDDIPYMKWNIKFMFETTNQLPTIKHVRKRDWTMRARCRYGWCQIAQNKMQKYLTGTSWVWWRSAWKSWGKFDRDKRIEISLIEANWKDTYIYIHIIT